MRFLVGCCVSAVINFGIATIFFTSRSEMEQSQYYAYVLMTSWVWMVWIVLFAVASLGQWYGIARDCVNCVRRFTGVGIVAKAMWSFLFGVALFDPEIKTATGMGQWMALGLLSLELVFLALPNTPRLDEVLKRNRENRLPRTP